MRHRLELPACRSPSVTDVGRSHAIRWLLPSILTSSIREGETARSGVFADTVVITEKGARSLHAFPHELQRIGS